MEVHAHTHTARKKWTHYFWEFLMLFLAVFCGFLAENQREHYIEKQRARQYAQSFINDLKSDTAMVSRIMRQARRIVHQIDSMAELLQSKGIKEIKNIDLYVFFRLDQMYRPYTWSRTTLEQIKNSGSIRYFSNDSIIKRISAYDAFTRHMDEDYKNDEEGFRHFRESGYRVFDQNYPRKFKDALDSNMDSLVRTDYYNEMTINGPGLLTNDIRDIKVLVNTMLSLREGLDIRHKLELPGLKENAKELIILLKNEYHFK